MISNLFIFRPFTLVYTRIMENFLPLVYIVGWFALVFGASYLINWLLIRSVIRHMYRFFVAPGVVVHELSHALGCLVTGSQITEINFWKASGGHVAHIPPRDPHVRIISDPLIALAPIWGTFLLLGLLTRLVVPDVFGLLQNGDASNVFSVIDLLSWKTWLYLYLVTSLVATIAPSKTDMRYALASLIVLTILLIFLLFIPGFSTLLLNVGTSVLPFAIFTLGLMTVALLIAFLLALPNKDKHFVAKNQID